MRVVFIQSGLSNHVAISKRVKLLDEGYSFVCYEGSVFMKLFFNRIIPVVKTSCSSEYGVSVVTESNSYELLSGWQDSAGRVDVFSGTSRIVLRDNDDILVFHDTGKYERMSLARYVSEYCDIE